MTESHLLAEAARQLRVARHVVVFTGAGASAESGIPTFRDRDGIWREFPPEEFASWRGLWNAAFRRPRRLAEFVHAVVGPIAQAAPHAGHRSLVAMENYVHVSVITQNIDRLHQEAGSSVVHEIHGSLLEIVTAERRILRLLSRSDLRRVADNLERARRGWFPLLRTLVAIRPLVGLGRNGIYHPNLVLFGDALAEPAWSLAQQECRQCDVMIQVGCSGAVWPAALLPDEVRRRGAPVITIDPHEGTGDFRLTGTAAKLLPSLLAAAYQK